MNENKYRILEHILEEIDKLRNRIDKGYGLDVEKNAPTYGIEPITLHCDIEDAVYDYGLTAPCLNRDPPGLYEELRKVPLKDAKNQNETTYILWLISEAISEIIKIVEGEEIAIVCVFDSVEPNKVRIEGLDMWLDIAETLTVGLYNSPNFGLWP